MSGDATENSWLTKHCSRCPDASIACLEGIPWDVWNVASAYKTGFGQKRQALVRWYGKGGFMSKRAAAKRNDSTPARSVDEYLARLPNEVQATLQRLRNAIREAPPQAEELVSYQIPTYKYHGALVHFAAFESHLSFYVVDKSILTQFSAELQAYEKSGTTNHFSPENPIREGLVEKIVRTRIAQNEQRASSKRS